MGLAIKIISIPTFPRDFHHSHIFFSSSFPYLFHHSHNFKSFIIPIFSRLLFHHLIMNFSVSSHAPDIRSSRFKTHNVIKCPFYRMFFIRCPFYLDLQTMIFFLPSITRPNIRSSWFKTHIGINCLFYRMFYQMSVFFWIFFSTSFTRQISDPLGSKHTILSNVRFCLDLQTMIFFLLVSNQ